MNLLDILIILSTLMFLATNIMSSGFSKILELVIGIAIFYFLMSSDIVKDAIGDYTSYKYLNIALCAAIAYFAKYIIGFLFYSTSLFPVHMVSGPIFNIIDKTLLLAYAIGHTLFIIFILYNIALVQNNYGYKPTWFTNSYFAQQTKPVNKYFANVVGLQDLNKNSPQSFVEQVVGDLFSDKATNKK